MAQDAIPHRPLGTTGAQVSILGFGGFHLVETSLAQAATLLNTYLDLGGNYTLSDQS